MQVDEWYFSRAALGSVAYNLTNIIRNSGVTKPSPKPINTAAGAFQLVSGENSIAIDPITVTSPTTICNHLRVIYILRLMNRPFIGSDCYRQSCLWHSSFYLRILILKGRR